MTAVETLIADYIHIMTGTRPGDVSALLPTEKEHNLVLAFGLLEDGKRHLNMIHCVGETQVLNRHLIEIDNCQNEETTTAKCSLAQIMKYANEAGGFDMGNSFIRIFASTEIGIPIALGVPNANLDDYDVHSLVYPL